MGAGHAVILGRFRLTERLGTGGFGTVYRGWDERLERPVAVKEIEGGAGARVLREAHAAARLNHAGIVTLYELGEEGGRAYLVSELVDGSTLGELIGAGALSDRDLGRIGAELCEALKHAHGRGVVHRDIKPQNALVPADRSRAKLMDFGIARLAEGASLTETGEVVGTIAYMAPEQAEGAQVTPASDVYSLGLTLYEGWVGEHPVARHSPAATARRIGAPIPPLRRFRPDLPEELTELVDACLDTDPERRPELDELRGGLRAATRGLDSEAALPAPAAAQPGEAPVRGFWLAGYVAAVCALCAWLASSGGRPGAALVLAFLATPVVWSLRRAPRLLPLPSLAPALGSVGLSAVYPALAGLADTPRRRALTAALGYVWLAATALALGVTGPLGEVGSAPATWDRSLAGGAELIASLIAPQLLLGAAVWTTAALAFAVMVRGRLLALDALGALVWSAGVVAAHRALGEGTAGPTPPGGLLLAAALGLALFAALRRGSIPRARRASPVPTALHGRS